ncbi:MAG: hypothetical protein JRI59_07580 [Deltaproteobacteria bacterium]|nr:hypothetical protein [Deltaproteobacteria bacterium]
MRKLCWWAAALLVFIGCATMQSSVQEEIARASITRGKLSGPELRDCARALRQAGQQDLLRVTGGTKEYNHYTDTLMYYPRFLLKGGGWGEAVIKVTGPATAPELLVLKVQRYARYGP